MPWIVIIHSDIIRLFKKKKKKIVKRDNINYSEFYLNTANKTQRNVWISINENVLIKMSEVL